MSRILSEVHENARGLHRVGLVSDDEMRTFDVLCIPKIPTYSAEMIRAFGQRPGSRNPSSRPS